METVFTRNTAGFVLFLLFYIFFTYIYLFFNTFISYPCKNAQNSSHYYSDKTENMKMLSTFKLSLRHNKPIRFARVKPLRNDFSFRFE